MSCAFSAVAWQLMLSRPGNGKETGRDQEQSGDANAAGGDLSVLLFRSLIGSDKAVSPILENDLFFFYRNSFLNAYVIVL